MSFRVIRNPSAAELGQLQSANPANPFASASYAEARQALGASVVLFAAESHDEAQVSAVGYVDGHPLSRNLELTSSPSCLPQADFWHGVEEFCHQNHVADVAIDSYGSPSITLPTWPVPAQVRDRTEWVLNLVPADSMRFASNHRRNINKARKSGVTITSTTDPVAAHAHGRVMAASMQRRALRGENVPVIEDDNTRYDSAFLISGAATIFQAVHDGEVVSSMLILRAPSGAYYQSAGTTPVGMEIGASTFLVSEIIRALVAEGKTVFNLGGAGPESEGLRRFKSGFGAQPVSLQAATYQLASPLHKKIRAAVRLLREPLELGKTLSRRRAAS